MLSCLNCVVKFVRTWVRVVWTVDGTDFLLIEELLGPCVLSVCVDSTGSVQQYDSSYVQYSTVLCTYSTAVRMMNYHSTAAVQYVQKNLTGLHYTTMIWYTHCAFVQYVLCTVDTIDLIFLHSKQLKKLFGFGPHSSQRFSGENDHILSTCTCCEMLKKNFRKGCMEQKPLKTMTTGTPSCIHSRAPSRTCVAWIAKKQYILK